MTTVPPAPPFPYGPLVVTRENLWSSIDILLRYVEAEGRDQLSGAIGRLARFRAALDPAAGTAVENRSDPTAVPAGFRPPAEPTPATADLIERLKADLEEDAPPGKAGPADQDGAAGPTPQDRAYARRLRIADLLALNGPTGSGALADTLGIPHGTISGLLMSCPWFKKSKPYNVRAPWEVTDAGRTALDLAHGTSTRADSKGSPAAPAGGSPETERPSTTPTEPEGGSPLTSPPAAPCGATPPPGTSG